MKKEFLYDYQLNAVHKMKNGCILNGGVGSGKSRTALYYFFTKMYKDLNNIYRDLYIITTARKRDTKEWEEEIKPFDSFMKHKINIVIDSWNNIKKYSEVSNAFFIFDEQRVVGYGAWTKTFLKITILLTTFETRLYPPLGPRRIKFCKLAFKGLLFISVILKETS